MANADEIDRIRDRMHDLADTLGAVVTRVEVSATKLEAASSKIDRIETDLAETKSIVLVMQTRASDASKSGAKWGGVVGGALAAAAWILSQLKGQ